jgi:hypothetical protein
MCLDEIWSRLTSSQANIEVVFILNAECTIVVRPDSHEHRFHILRHVSFGAEVRFLHTSYLWNGVYLLPSSIFPLLCLIQAVTVYGPLFFTTDMLLKEYKCQPAF